MRLARKPRGWALNSPPPASWVKSDMIYSMLFIQFYLVLQWSSLELGQHFLFVLCEWNIHSRHRIGSESGKLLAVVRGWRNRGDRGTGPLGPLKFHILGGTEGDPIFLKMGPFDWHCVFLVSYIFLHTLCGPFWRLGPFSVGAPKACPPPPPPPRNSFLQACCCVSFLT